VALILPVIPTNVHILFPLMCSVQPYPIFKTIQVPHLSRFISFLYFFFSSSFVFLFPIMVFICTCDDLRSPNKTNKTSNLFACKLLSFPLHTFVATKVEMYFLSCFIENTSHLEHCLPSSTLFIS
jgi:hypothetical protein